MPDFSTDTTFLGDLFGGGQTYDLPIDWSALFGGAWPEYMSDPGLASVMGGEQLYFDTQTGQVVTLAQAQAIDPTFTGAGGGGYTGASDVLSSGGSQATGPFGFGGTSNTSDAINQQHELYDYSNITFSNYLNLFFNNL